MEGQLWLSDSASFPCSARCRQQSSTATLQQGRFLHSPAACLDLTGSPKPRNRRAHTQGWLPRADDAQMSLSILESANSETVRTTWQDHDARKLETHMTEIAVQIVVTAEIQHREAAVRQFQWRVQRKAALEEEERRRRLEAERAERERQKRLEKARGDRLLRDAMAF